MSGRDSGVSGRGSEFGKVRNIHSILRNWGY